MITVILYGELGKLYGKYHKYSVRNVPEAMRALEANFKGFSKHIRKDGEYRVVVDKKPINETELFKTAIYQIKIIPVVQGSGKAGSIILGIGLLSLGWFNPMGFLTTGVQGFALSAMKSLGMSLLLGGVSQMLTKTPNLNAGDRADTKTSYAFNGPVNVSAQGNPAPLAYGKVLAGSQVISAGLEVIEKEVLDETE